MNEKQKLGIIIGTIILVFALIVGIGISENKKNQELMDIFDTLFNGSENKAVYIMRTGCSWCQLFEPNMEEMKENYGADVLTIDTNNISEKAFNYILEKLGLNSSSFGTPYTAIVGNGKVVESISGYVDVDSLFEKFKENNIIAETSELPLNYLDYEEYKKILNSKQKELIVITQTGCSACIKAMPVLNEIAREYEDLKMNIFNIYYLTEEEQKEFLSSLEYLNEEDWGTPLMLVVENNKVVNTSNGFKDKETYVEFLKQTGFIK